jgi:ABC-type lipoprotein release transport system permease subunit
MRQALTLAFRNVFRSPKRSLSLLALMCSAFLAITLIKAGYAYMFANVRKSVAAGSGDVRFSLKEDAGLGLEEYRSLKARILADGRFRETRAAIPVQGLVGTEANSAPASGLAIEGGFAGWKGGDGSVKADVGEALARTLGVKEGDSFSGLLNDSGFDLVLASVVKTEARTLDRFFIRLPLEALEERGARTVVDTVSIWFSPAAEDRKAAIEELRAWPEFQRYQCSAYELGNTVANSIVNVYEDNFRVVLAVVVATMLLALSNVMLLSSWERGQEWGTMLALGNRFPDLVLVLALEALILALAASAIGGALTVAISAAVNALGGITLPPPPTATGPMHIGLSPEAASFALALCASLCCGLAAALLAAWGLRRSTIIELLFERN